MNKLSLATRIKKLGKENWGFLLFVLLMFASRSSLADWYHVPSGSMLPTIEVGDRILVDKMAYRLEIPFTDIVVLETGQPKRGDVVIFVSKAADERLVKRVIGLPGDLVSMVNNQLVINGQIIRYSPSKDQRYFRESLLGIEHLVQFVKVPNARDTFNNIAIPEGFIFVMGDNRNNSMDSRYYGLVPLEEIQGKAINVLYSLDAGNFYAPKSERFLKNLI